MSGQNQVTFGFTEIEESTGINFII